MRNGYLPNADMRFQYWGKNLHVTFSDPEEQIAESPYVIQQPWEYRGCWEKVFGSAGPVVIEVGMGKGKFIMELATAHPDINYVGIEMYSSVLLKAIQKRKDTKLSNLWFLRADANALAFFTICS